MYSDWHANAAVVLTTILAVTICTLVHYEGLSWIARTLPRHHGPRRRLVLYAVCGAMLLHIVEIWLFGIAYHLLLLWPSVGQIRGTISDGLLDHVYFSATVYTTVGFGDLSPVGPIRFLAGTEGLTGFMLIGWSASFTFLEMERYWRNR
jgi:Ion channel